MGGPPRGLPAGILGRASLGARWGPRTASWLFGSRRSAPASSAPHSYSGCGCCLRPQRQSVVYRPRSPRGQSWLPPALPAMSGLSGALWGPSVGLAGWLALRIWWGPRGATAVPILVWASPWPVAGPRQGLTPPYRPAGAAARPCLASLSACSLPKSPEWAWPSGTGLGGR